MKLLLVVCGMALLSILPNRSIRAQDPISEAIRQGIIKVIKAIDLKIQRLQNETIWLQNAQKAMENTMSKLKLNEITNWVEKQRKLYDDYFQELWQVKAAVATYHQVKDVIALQLSILNEYKAAYSLFRNDKHFTPEEIQYMYDVYSGILNESMKNIEAIFLVINSFAMQMSDAKRMEIIHSAYDGLQKTRANLKQFNNQNKVLSLQRAEDKAEVERLRHYYGF